MPRWCQTPWCFLLCFIATPEVLSTSSVKKLTKSGRNYIGLLWFETHHSLNSLGYRKNGEKRHGTTLGPNKTSWLLVWCRQCMEPRNSWITISLVHPLLVTERGAYWYLKCDGCVCCAWRLNSQGRTGRRGWRRCHALQGAMMALVIETWAEQISMADLGLLKNWGPQFMTMWTGEMEDSLLDSENVGESDDINNIYIYMCVYVYIYIYMYMYIYNIYIYVYISVGF